MATTIRRRVQVGTVATSTATPTNTAVKVRSISNVTRVEASTADWYTLNNQIESISEKINSLETKVDNLDERFTTLTTAVNGKADQATTLSGYGITDALTYEEIV